MMVIEYNHIGLTIHESTNKDEVGPLKKKINGTVLNKVNNTENEIKQIQRRVQNGV